jgi:hypothetical protein
MHTSDVRAKLLLLFRKICDMTASKKLMASGKCHRSAPEEFCADECPENDLS